MNEKEFNLQVLAELKRIAKEVFSKVEVSKEGTYTAAELWNRKNAMGEPIVIKYGDSANDMYTAQVGTFSFRVSAQDVFLRLWKFEQLCKIRQADKARFTYGQQEGENISEKAMYLDKDGKATSRKKNLIKISERVAIEPDKKTKRYNMYYFVASMWYLLCQGFDESQYKAIKQRIEKDDNYLWKLLQKWDFNTDAPIQPIYKALFEALKSERENNTSEERKCEKEAGNSVICDVVIGRTNYGALRIEQRKLKRVGGSLYLYKDNDNLYFWYDKLYYCLGGYTHGVATFLKEQGNNIRTKIREMIEQGGINTESAKILYEKMRKDDTHVNSKSVEETNEDYPPEPYNEADAGEPERPMCIHSEKPANKISNLQKMQFANSWGNSCYVLPGYLRQKVFPTELFNERRKTSRF